MNGRRAKEKRRVDPEMVIDYLLEKMIRSRGGAGEHSMRDLKAELRKAVEKAISE